MKRSSRFAGLLCSLLFPALVFAGPDQLTLSYKLSFGSAGTPAHMELSLRGATPLALLEDELPAGPAQPWAAPLWSADVCQGQLCAGRVLGLAYGSAVERNRMNADGDSGVVGWLWGGVAVVGALVLVAVAAGGGGGENGDGPNDRPTASGGPSAEVGGCQIVQTNLQDPASPNIFNCNIGGG